MEKVVVVTGASSGIGKELAIKYVGKGYKVYGVSINGQAPEGVVSLTADVSNKEQVETAFSKIFEESGHIDILINNAGMGISGAVENATEKDIRKIIDVNFMGVVNCTQAVLPKMRERRSGKIINTSSVAGVLALQFQAFYSATKGAVTMFTDALRNEMRPFKVQVMQVLPGDVKTGFTKNRVKNVVESEYKARETKSVESMERDEQNGYEPSAVAARIVKISEKKKLPHARVIGFKYKLFMALAKFLPKRFVLFVMYKLW